MDRLSSHKATKEIVNKHNFKFSKSLGDIFYNMTYRGFSKPTFAQYLAFYAEEKDIDEKFIRLFKLISD